MKQEEKEIEFKEEENKGAEMGFAVKWDELEVLNEVVKGVSGLIKSDSEDKAKNVERLIMAGEKFVRAVMSLDEQYIKAETEGEKKRLWELMEELVSLIGSILKVIDKYLVGCRVKDKVSREKLMLLKDLRTAYKYFTGEISLNINEEELKRLEEEARNEGRITWKEFISELGLSE